MGPEPMSRMVLMSVRLGIRQLSRRPVCGDSTRSRPVIHRRPVDWPNYWAWKITRALLVAKRFDRIEPAGPPCRVEAEKDAGREGKYEGADGNTIRKGRLLALPPGRQKREATRDD